MQHKTWVLDAMIAERKQSALIVSKGIILEKVKIKYFITGEGIK